MNNLYYNNRKLKQIEKKRTQKTKKIWGWILTAVGALELPNAIAAMGTSGTSGLVSGIISCLLFLIPGLYLLLSAKRQVDRWDRYEAIIDNRGNTPISLIAKKMKLPETVVYSDLQEMIHDDFFIGPNYNIEAYLDAERDLLVMTSGGEPLKPLPDPPTEEERAQAAAASSRKGWFGAGRGRGKQDNRPGDTESAGVAGAAGASDADEAADESRAEEPVTEEEELSDLELIRKAIAETKDDEVRGYLYGLEGSVRRIDERLQDQPDLREKLSIRRLYKYYLPQIIELIRKYQAPDTPADLKEQIRDALRTSANALSNIEADLLEREQMDAETDIEVLKNMFAQDGLLDRNARPQAQPHGQPQPQSQPRPRAQSEPQARPQSELQPQSQPQPQVRPQGR